VESESSGLAPRRSDHRERASGRQEPGRHLTRRCVYASMSRCARFLLVSVSALNRSRWTMKLNRRYGPPLGGRQGYASPAGIKVMIARRSELEVSCRQGSRRSPAARLSHSCESRIRPCDIVRHERQSPGVVLIKVKFTADISLMDWQAFSKPGEFVEKLGGWAGSRISAAAGIEEYGGAVTSGKRRWARHSSEGPS